MIHISKPKVEKTSNLSKLTAVIEIDGVKQKCFFEIEKKWEKYLTYEVADAFVIGLFHRALCLGHDIISEAPVSEELLYGIENILIPNLCFGDKNIKKIEIKAKTIKSPPSSGAVGTGLSCGIDSFQAIKENSSNKFPAHKITHLCFFNCGAFYSDENNFFAMQKNIKSVAKQLDLPIIIGNSNIHKIIPGDYQITHTFYSLFCIFALRKLFSIYYYASTEPFVEFSCSNASIIGQDSARYDLMTFHALSDENLRLYSAGSGVKTRIEKTKQIANEKIVQKNIDVCMIHGNNNCGRCLKCRRTMLQLWMIGKLDDFKDRFPVDYFYKHLKEYLRWMKQNKNKTLLEKETYEEYKKLNKKNFFVFFNKKRKL